MLFKPGYFSFLNILIYLVLLGIFGFHAAVPVSIFFALFIIYYNQAWLGLRTRLILAICYLLLFDSEAFTFTALNLRAWYFLLIYYYWLFAIDNRFIMPLKINRGRFSYLMLIGILAFLSIFYLIIDPVAFKIHNLKYWIFSVGLIYALFNEFKRFPLDKIILLDFFISLTIFVSVWGVIQFASNQQGISNFMLDYYNIRPSAFFSETTWYSEYILFGMFLLLLRVRYTKQYYFLAFVPFIIAGILFSATRNTYLGFGIFLFFTMIFTLTKKKVKVSFLRNRYSLVLVFLLVLGIVVFQDLIIHSFEKIYDKFNLTDRSGQGRILAFKLSWELIKEKFLIGHGFYWGKELTLGISGTSIGAKSFNLFLMVFHIFGLIGFLPFLLLVFTFFFSLISQFWKSKSVFSEYAIIIFTSFLVMAMFAPIHQFPFGMFVVALSLYLNFLSEKEKNLLPDAPI